LQELEEHRVWVASSGAIFILNILKNQSFGSKVERKDTDRQTTW
jgi:hypothetical protein